MRKAIRDGARLPGGIVSYPLEKIYREVAYIAYHFHWSRGEIMDMTHSERRVWVKEISKINQDINEQQRQ
jgi:hypothetical protein